MSGRFEEQATKAAVQYLRMSTEHQRYSIPSQNAAIAAFARARGYTIIESYIDAGKSGLMLKHRNGLQRLLADVVMAGRSFGTILVYDVSRWGRFQDPDQAAHYEFICREAGVNILYCAEPFENLDPVSGGIMKMLKRVMAAEFSRDLSQKICRGRLHGAGLGLWVGSSAPYGLRREAFDLSGTAKILDRGERNSLKSLRIRLVPGPKVERDTVRRIFRLYVEAQLLPREIAEQLNADGIASVTGRPWSVQAVLATLRNELYLGLQTFNRTSRHLRGPPHKNPADSWVKVRIMDPIVPPALFKAAARRRAGHRYRLRRKELLDGLRGTLKRHGRISYETISQTPEAPSGSCYTRRFGSLKEACAEIGYEWASANAGPRFDREQVLDFLRALHGRQGFLNTATINADPDLPTANTIASYFGGLPKAYAAAGLDGSMPTIRRAAYRRTREKGVPSPRRVRKFSRDQILQELKRIYTANGALSKQIIDADLSTPCFTTVRFYCGTLREIRDIINSILPA